MHKIEKGKLYIELRYFVIFLEQGKMPLTFKNESNSVFDYSVICCQYVTRMCLCSLYVPQLSLPTLLIVFLFSVNNLECRGTHWHSIKNTHHCLKTF